MVRAAVSFEERAGILAGDGIDRRQNCLIKGADRPPYRAKNQSIVEGQPAGLYIHRLYVGGALDGSDR